MTKDLTKLIYDPYALLEHRLEDITNTVGVIADPGTPFSLGLETSALFTTNAMAEMVQTYKLLYSSLGKVKQDLFHHISNDNELNMFAVPSDIKIQFYIKKQDIITYGMETDNGYYTVLPELTKVKHEDMTFTLLNKITVALHDTGPFVNMEPSTILDTQRDIINKTHGVLKSTYGKDAEGIEYVIFSAVLQQIDIITYTDHLTANEVFDFEVPITDNYYMMQAKLTLNNVPTPIAITHSEEIIDPGKITMLVKDNDNTVSLRIPMLYQQHNFISGLITISIFTTKGKQILSLENKDLTVEFPEEVLTTEEGTIHSIQVLAYTNMVLDGGINKRPFKEIKDNIIFNSIGNINIPITDYQMFEAARLRGFEINKSLDTLTERLYTVTKPLNSNPYGKEVIASPLFNVVAEIILDKYLDSSDIIIDPNYIMIKPTGIFRYADDKTMLLTRVEKAIFLNLPIEEQVETMNSQELFFTPYYYRVDNKYDVVNTHIYDLDSPKILGTHVLSKNLNSIVNVNSNINNIKTSDNGYLFGINLIGNSLFEGLVPQTIKGRLMVLTGETPVYIDGEYINEETLVFPFNSDLLVDSDDKLHLTNGESILPTKYISLSPGIKLYLYMEEDAPNNTGFTQPADIGLGENNEILTIETYELEFGIPLDYLWSKSVSSYTSNKFVRYTEDKLLRYQTEVYEMGEDGCPILTVDENEECNEYNLSILRQRGEVVKDGNGIGMYEYRKGEVVMTNDEPTINQISGMVKYVDLTCINYMFKHSKSDIYSTYLHTLLLHVKSWFEIDLVKLNSTTLDQTVIKFIPSRGLLDTKLGSGLYISPKVYPKVTIYVNSSDRATIPDINQLRNAIGDIFNHRFSSKQIVMSDIKDDIMKKYSFVIGVRVEDVFIGSEIINIVDGYSLPYLGTSINQAGIIRYNMSIFIEETDG